MALKSVRIIKSRKKKKKKSKSIGRILVGGATAMVGVALFQQAAGAVNRL